MKLFQLGKTHKGNLYTFNKDGIAIFRGSSCLRAELSFMLEEMAFDPIAGCEGYPCLIADTGLEAIPHNLMDTNRETFRAMAKSGMAGVIKQGLSGKYYLFTFNYKHAEIL